MNSISPKLLKTVTDHAAKHPKSLVALLEYSGIYRYVSPSHADLLGYDPDELLGTVLDDIIAPEDHSHINLALGDAVMTNSSVEITINLIHHDGDYIRAKAQAWSVADPESGERFVIGISTPVKS